MSKHMRYECKHGIVTAQCRCPSSDKVVRIVDCSTDCERKDASDVQVPEVF